MAFIIHTIDTGGTRPLETLPIGAGLAIECGTALVLTAGKLALATGTTKPTHVSATDRASTTDGEIIPTVRVSEDIVFETLLGAKNTSLARGAKYTIDTDGNTITATTTGGVAEVVSFDGTEVGDKVRVRL